VTALKAAEADILRTVRDVKCDPGCPCESWATALADHLRRELPDVDDLTLARVTLIAGLHGRGWAKHGDADAIQVSAIQCTAAAELAALHLD